MSERDERDEQTRPEEQNVEESELGDENGDVLPKRETRSVIDLGEGGGLAPPAP
jgi:hypothetical protein